jgi:tRNA-dihydrouridine synthase
MPVVELAKRLEGAGVRAMTIHCRTALMGHEGKADWRWARDAQKAVTMPILVNGDIQSASDAKRALEETGCRGVMIGRRAIAHPWIFREVQQVLSGRELSLVRAHERFALCLEQLNLLEQAYAPGRAVRTMRRFYPGYLEGTSGLRLLLRRLASETSLEKTRVMLREAEEDLRR